ncbi:carboxylate-amine ligase [Rhodococcus sp. CH91]|uniref:carboxylate-amine ligase n=1 Tax=Rhodococcus sp. CH91 TaxID=2910256 RepID=UPI001F4A6623|nr:glutamate--cysteine ligase [Rhodococcus sp. CH91]
MTRRPIPASFVPAPVTNSRTANITSEDSGPTVGVEEEFFLVAPTADRLTESNDLVVTSARQLGARIDYELKRIQIEVDTPVCRTATDLRAHILAGRAAAAAVALQHRMGVLASGASPTVQRLAAVTDLARYRTMADRYGRLVAEQEVCGCHVHVGVADPEIAIQVCNHVRLWLPILLASTANSPLHRGHDTGYASWRSIIAGRWPCSGPPPRFTSAAHYDTVVAMMIDSGNILDVGMVYWDVRPSAHLPTVEVRVSDVPASADETILLATIVRALVATCERQVRAGVPAPPVTDEVLRAAYLCAAREGATGRAIDVFTGRTTTARHAFRGLLRYIRPQLEDTGDYRRTLKMSAKVFDRGTGAVLQRRAFERRHDTADVVDALTRQFVAEPWTHTLSGGTRQAPDAHPSRSTNA